MRLCTPERSRVCLLSYEVLSCQWQSPTLRGRSRADMRNKKLIATFIWLSGESMHKFLEGVWASAARTLSKEPNNVKIIIDHASMICEP